MRESAIMLFLIILSACSHSPRQPPGAAGPSHHSVHNDRLRELMAEMNALAISEKEMTDQQKDVKRRKYYLKMAENAELMEKTVDDILHTLPLLKLGQEDQATFKAMAESLRSESKELGEMASSNRIDKMSGQLTKIDLTCQACHQLFR